MYPIVAKYWNMQKMAASSSRSGSLSAAVLKAVDTAVKDEAFVPTNAVLLQVARSVELIAHRLEGCPCHEDIWTSRQRFEARTAALQAHSGHKHCPWKGCWGPLMALGMSEKLVAQALHARSPEVVSVLSSASAEVRLKVLVVEQQLRSSIAGELQHRWSFWQAVPYKLFGRLRRSAGG